MVLPCSWKRTLVPTAIPLSRAGSETLKAMVMAGHFSAGMASWARVTLAALASMARITPVASTGAAAGMAWSP